MSDITILCIDDDPDVLLVMQTVIEKGGYKCITASGGDEGMKLFEENDPDAVIIDMMMERIDSGSRLAENIRNNHPEKPLYILSSIGDNISRMTDSGQLAVDGILQKPVDGDRLLEMLQERFS